MLQKKSQAVTSLEVFKHLLRSTWMPQCKRNLKTQRKTLEKQRSLAFNSTPAPAESGQTKWTLLERQKVDVGEPDSSTLVTYLLLMANLHCKLRGAEQASPKRAGSLHSQQSARAEWWWHELCQGTAANAALYTHSQPCWVAKHKAPSACQSSIIQQQVPCEAI